MSIFSYRLKEHGIKRDMQEYVDNKAQEFKFDQAIQGLSTRGMSTKGKEIISEQTGQARERETA